MVRCLISLLLLYLCIVWGAHADVEPNFADDVAPIFEARCTRCHQPGQVAPMSLQTYAEVRPWVKSIAQQISRREMPPFHAAGPIGKFRDDPRLTDEEVELILRWVKSGAPRGRPIPRLEAASFPVGTFTAGEPDIVIEFAKHTVRGAESGLSDVYMQVFTDFAVPDDIWIRGYEWQFNDYRVVHHAFARFLQPDYVIPSEKVVENLSKPVRTSSGLAAWFPGQGPVMYPQGTARFITMGERPVATVHYAPKTGNVESQPRLGLYLYDGELSAHWKAVHLSIKDLPFLLPPNESNYEKMLSKAFLHDGLVHSFRVHMHYRGKRANIWFTYPDGRREQVFSLPRYSFDWQRRYELANPLLVGKGTIVEVELVWDNSAENPFNPNPDAEVQFGSRSYDEMGGVHIDFQPISDDLTTVTIDNGRLVGMRYSDLPERFVSPGTLAVGRALQRMSEEERYRLIGDALQRMSKEERNRLIRNALQRMTDEEREKFPFKIQE